MKKVWKILRKILMVMGALVVLSGIYTTWRFWNNFSDDEIASTSGNLICSWESYKRYTTIMLNAGKMTIGIMPDSGTRKQQRAMLDAYERLNLSGPETVITAGHYPSGELFIQDCAAEKCTIEEMSAPMNACQTKYFNECTDLAVRFRGVNYCLLEPSEER